MDEYLDAELASAEAAGFSFKVEVKENGLNIKCSGFNEKLETLVDMVAKALKSIGEHLTEPAFDVHKDSLEQELSIDITTGSFFNDFDKTFTERHRLHKIVYYNEMKRMEFNDFKLGVEKFFEKLRIKVLVQGNFSRNDATSIGNSILQNFGGAAVTDVSDDFQFLKFLSIVDFQTSSIERKSLELPLGRSSIKFKAIKSNDKNSKTSLSYDLGARSLQQDAITDLLVSVVDEEFFSTLRTQEQLGYSVSLEALNSTDANALSFFIQSQEDNHSAKDVAARIERYVQVDMREILEHLSEEKFAKIKEANIKKKLTPNIDLKSEVKSNWTQIIEGKYAFNKKQKDAETIATIAKNDLNDLYTSKLVGEETRKLLCCLVGNIESAQANSDEIPTLKTVSDKYSEDENIVGDIVEFKNGLNEYPKYLMN